VPRTRARRVVALAGMLATVAGIIGLRTATMPPTTQALDSPGLARAQPTHQPTHQVPHRQGTNGGSSGDRVLIGKPYDVNYGIVQVKVKMKGHRITDITPMSLPQGGRSSDISRYAAPQLRREALAAQSAHVDAVSGASYTSAGYAQSLQSALDQAGK
jgi:uncharacterized protein with FMN-binding domain